MAGFPLLFLMIKTLLYFWLSGCRLGWNYWGGVDPVNDASKFPDVAYTVNDVSGWTNTFSDVWCGTGLDFFPNSPILGAGGVEQDTNLKCEELYLTGRSLIEHKHYKAGYDTLKYMVENCAPNNFWPYSQMAFDEMPAGLFYTDDPLRVRKHLEWLKSVLYLNTINPLYYCEAAEAIMRAIAEDSVDSGIEFNNQLAVVKYILESGKCDFERDDWEEYYRDYRRQQRDAYLRMLDFYDLDSNEYPLDTTLPSLEELDLTILLGPNGSVTSRPVLSPALLEVHASSNPFSTSTEIEYTLGRVAQVELSLHNALGQTVWHRPFGKVEDAAQHRVTLSGDDLQAGTYFLRVSTIEGEVKTVKLVKN